MNHTLTSTSILALFETNKEQRVSFVQSLIDAIESGDKNPLQIHLQVKAMEDLINILTNLDEKKNKNAALAKIYRKALLDEAAKYGKSFQLYNSKFEIKETGSKYDYSQCNDQEYNDLELQMEALKEKLTARQKFLQNVPDGGFDQVIEGGEVVRIYRASKTSTTSVTVTLK